MLFYKSKKREMRKKEKDLHERVIGNTQNACMLNMRMKILRIGGKNCPIIKKIVRHYFTPPSLSYTFSSSSSSSSSSPDVFRGEGIVRCDVIRASSSSSSSSFVVVIMIMIIIIIIIIIIVGGRSKKNSPRAKARKKKTSLMTRRTERKRGERKRGKRGRKEDSEDI